MITSQNATRCHLSASQISLLENKNENGTSKESLSEIHFFSIGKLHTHPMAHPPPNTYMGREVPDYLELIGLSEIHFKYKF